MAQMAWNKLSRDCLPMTRRNSLLKVNDNNRCVGVIVVDLN